MSTALEPVHGRSATDGRIAAINLESARRRAWSRFAQNDHGVAEAIVNMERLSAQFLGDVGALDRLELIAAQFAGMEKSARAALIQAEVASTVHRFADTREHLAHAATMGATPDAIERQLLAIDQACGVQIDVVLDARYRIAAETGQLEDLVPLGAMLADLERYAEADAVYRQAYDTFNGTSPFPLAWVCFQLGVLWGELLPEPDLDLAARWYRRAISFLPGYVKARIHLAEVYAGRGQISDAKALLLPTLSSSDPEAQWRFADILIALKRLEEADAHLEAAQRGFESLLAKHLLAFVDHAAEFYAGSGNDPERALGLARINAANRPTRRAIAQANGIAERLHEPIPAGRGKVFERFPVQPGSM